MAPVKRWLPLALLAMLLLPGAAQACGVPCGYVYPRLLFDLGERGQRVTLTTAQPLQLDGTLTFTWDITNEGMAAHNPASPIVVSFAFPRKPPWLDVQVEPARIEIPLSPQHVQPVDGASGAQLEYRYTTPIQVRAALTTTPEVDPEQPPSLLILAQSSESGLYKPGFGVRDIPLDLPEALVQARQEGPRAALRIADAQPAQLRDLEVAFGGATLSLAADAPVEPWKPAALVATARGPGGAARAVDMAATVVDEANAIHYTTGLRHREDGTLPFQFTFPGAGQFRVLVAARPVPVASDAGFEPLVAEFPVLIPGVGYDALRMPDAYRFQSREPVADFHANAQDLPRQFEKLVRFPVAAGADSASVQVSMGSTLGAALGAGSLYVEVLGPQDEQLTYGKLDTATPSLDQRLHGPLAKGDYKLHIYGTGLNPLGMAGTLLDLSVGVFYTGSPLAMVEARGAPRPLMGGAIPLGTGGMELDLVLAEEPALWRPLHAQLVAKDAAGRVALHPDFILTVRGPEGILYTTGHRHPHDGLLAWSFTPPAPGLYTVSAYAGPTPEASGAFWQPAIASWPLLLAAPSDGVVRYPATYEAQYHDSTAAFRPEGYAEAAPFDKRYPVPVKAGATRLAATLGLSTMAMVQHVEGQAPAALTLSLLGPEGQVLASQQVAGTGQAAVESSELPPGTYQLRVAGVGYAPLDYSGAMYALGVAVEYPEGIVERLPGAAAEGQGQGAPRGVPAAEPVLVLLGFALVALAARRRR